MYNTFEMLTVFGIAGNGTLMHLTIPKSGVAAFEQVHRGLNVHGG